MEGGILPMLRNILRRFHSRRRSIRLDASPGPTQMKYPSAEYDALVEGFRRKVEIAGSGLKVNKIHPLTEILESRPKKRGRPKGSKNKPKPSSS